MDIREWIGVGGLGFLFLLLALRIPVALAMFLVALVGSFVLSLATPFLRFDAYLLQFQSSFCHFYLVPLFVLHLFFLFLPFQVLRLLYSVFDFSSIQLLTELGFFCFCFN